VFVLFRNLQQGLQQQNIAGVLPQTASHKLLAVRQNATNLSNGFTAAFEKHACEILYLQRNISIKLCTLGRQ